MNRWGWVSTIFELCNGDITKMDLVCERGIIEVLNWLSYETEKSNLIKNKSGQSGQY